MSDLEKATFPVTAPPMTTSPTVLQSISTLDMTPKTSDQSTENLGSTPSTVTTAEVVSGE